MTMKTVKLNVNVRERAWCSWSHLLTYIQRRDGGPFVMGVFHIKCASTQNDNYKGKKFTRKVVGAFAFIDSRLTYI